MKKNRAYDGVPRYYEGSSGKESRELPKQLGRCDRTNHKPAELSGGQRQRIARARAFADLTGR